MQKKAVKIKTVQIREMKWKKTKDVKLAWSKSKRFATAS